MRECDNGKVMDRPGWDPEGIAIALGAFPVPRLHATHGEGFHYAVGGTAEESQTSVEVYPTSGMARITTESIQLTIAKAKPPTSTEQGLLFNDYTPTEYRTVMVTEHGEVALFVNPNPPLEAPLDVIAEEPPPDENTPVIISGRLVQDPIEGRTRQNALMARLSVRTNGEESSRDIFAFGPYAHDALEYFHEGGDYTFIGETKTYSRDGEPREIFSLKTMTIGKREARPSAEVSADHGVGM